MSFETDRPTPEGAEFVHEMTQQAQHYSVSAIMSCDCGCGQRGRVEMDFDQTVVIFDDPFKVDQLITVLIESRLHVWGPPPEK